MTGGAYSLLTGVGYVPVRLEERPDVERLAPPDGAVHRPVEREFKRPAVQGPRQVVRRQLRIGRVAGVTVAYKAAFLLDMMKIATVGRVSPALLAEAGGELVSRALTGALVGRNRPC